MTLKITSTRVVETSATTNNSPSQDYTNPTQWLWRWLPHRLSKHQSQPTTVLTRTTQTRPNDSEDDFHTGCPNVRHSQQQSFSGLHKPDPMTLKMTSTQVVQTSVTTNNSPNQDYTNPDDQPTTNIDSINTNCMTDLILTLKMTSTRVVETSATTNNSPNQDYTNPTQWLWRWLPHGLSKRQSQPTTVLRITQTRTNDSEDDHHTGCRNVSHNQQQSLPGLHKPDPMTLKMTSTQVVQTSVTTNNIPSQDYTNPTKWLWRWLPHRLSKRQSQPTTVLTRITQTRPNDSEDDFHTGCPNISHNQQQS